MRKTLFIIGMMALINVAHANNEAYPRYKPSSRSPEPVDIRTNAYGFSQSAPQALRIGDIAPDFEVLSPDETVIKTKALREDGPLVLVFYRGHW